jgi:hypothetical protein
MSIERDEQGRADASSPANPMTRAEAKRRGWLS